MDPPAAAKAAAPIGPSLSTYSSGHFTASKAGMGAADPARVAAIIEASSRGSKFHANAQAREQQLTERIAALKAEVGRLPASAMAAFARKMELFCAREEERRDLSRVVVHVDFDAFFCSCAELSDPTLRGTPFAVGSLSMISTASYAARAFGVRSAMPGFVGKQLCPDLKFVRHDGARYEAAAAQARAVFAEYDPGYASGTLDEASLDLTAHLAAAGIFPTRTEPAAGAAAGSSKVRPPRQPPTPAELAAIADVVTQLRTRVREATGGLTCSAGVAPNRLLAKICSDLNKPDGQTVCPFDREGILGILTGLPTRKIPGVGRVTERELVELGVSTCGDIRGRLGLVRAALGERAAQWLARSALGLTEAGELHASATANSGEDVGRKSISQERTFAENGNWPELFSRLAELAAAATAQLREERLLTGCVTVKIKLDSFEVLQHGRALQRPTDEPEILADAAAALFREVIASPSGAGGSGKQMRLRLLGVRFSTLQLAAPKATLLDGFLRRRPRTATLVDLVQDGSCEEAEEGELQSAPVADVPRRPSGPEPRQLRGPPDVIEIVSSDEDTSAENTTSEAASVGLHSTASLPPPRTSASAAPGAAPRSRVSAPASFLALCPVCGHLLPAHRPEEHVDACLQRRKRKRQLAATATPKPPGSAGGTAVSPAVTRTLARPTLGGRVAVGEGQPRQLDARNGYRATVPRELGDRLPRPSDGVLVGQEALETDGTSRVDAIGGHSDLSAKAVPEAVSEARGGVVVDA